jgi:hypothetical protein
MRRAGVVSAEHTPARIKPRFGQVAEYGSPVFVSKQPWDVLQQRESRSHFAKYPNGVGPAVAFVV